MIVVVLVTLLILLVAYLCFTQIPHPFGWVLGLIVAVLAIIYLAGHIDTASAVVRLL